MYAGTVPLVQWELNIQITMRRDSLISLTLPTVRSNLGFLCWKSEDTERAIFESVLESYYRLCKPVEFHD